MKTLLLCFFGLFISGCARWVHQIDVQQGNILTQTMVNSLQLGMDKRQVKHILGTPSIINSFQPQRWNYVYTHKTGHQPGSQHTITLDFVGEQLQKISGDISQLAVDDAVNEKVVIVPGTTPKPGIFSRWLD